MKKILNLSILFLMVFTLSSCDTSDDVKCGAGTVYLDGTCQASDTGNDNENPTDNEDPIDEENPTDNEDPNDDENPVDNTPDNALELIATNDFTSDDISSWATEGNVTLSHDADGYLVANVSGFTGEFYQENFQLPNMATEKDHTYTITIVAKTDVTEGRDVQFFLEDTDNNFSKFFLETEALTTDFQTFTYTYVATVANNDTKLGLFLGIMENSDLGNVIIDSITVVKEEGLIGDLLEDLSNSDFGTNDISNWEMEGNIELSYDENGYLVIKVTGLTGNFWEENVTYGDLITKGWTTYTVVVRIKGTVERTVNLFAEDTDNGFTKYAEINHTVTTEWTEITLTFTPTQSNSDTRIGLFLGEMENSALGTFYIDSITITADATFE